MPGLLVPGPLKLGFIYRAVEEWLGGRGFVRSVRAAHRRPDLQGRTIIVSGTVVRVYEEGGARRADIELVITNEDGRVLGARVRLGAVLLAAARGGLEGR